MAVDDTFESDDTMHHQLSPIDMKEPSNETSPRGSQERTIPSAGKTNESPANDVSELFTKEEVKAMAAESYLQGHNDLLRRLKNEGILNARQQIAEEEASRKKGQHEMKGKDKTKGKDKIKGKDKMKMEVDGDDRGNHGDDSDEREHIDVSDSSESVVDSDSETPRSRRAKQGGKYYTRTPMKNKSPAKAKKERNKEFDVSTITSARVQANW